MYKNPIPKLGSKVWTIRFDLFFEEEVEQEEAEENFIEYIKRNGLPKGCVVEVQ